MGDIQYLTAAAEVTIAEAQTHQTASASFQYLPPELLRIDVRGPLFRHVLTAVLDADTLWSLAEGRLDRLDAHKGLVDLLNIDLIGHDPVMALLGLVEPVGPADSIHVDYPRADRAVALVTLASGGQRRLWVDMMTGWVVAEERIDASGLRSWRRELGDYARVADSDAILPRKVHIESGERSLEIVFSEWRLDRELSREAMFKGLGVID